MTSGFLVDLTVRWKRRERTGGRGRRGRRAYEAAVPGMSRCLSQGRSSRRRPSPRCCSPWSAAARPSRRASSPSPRPRGASSGLSCRHTWRTCWTEGHKLESSLCNLEAKWGVSKVSCVLLGRRGRQSGEVSDFCRHLTLRLESERKRGTCRYLPKGSCAAGMGLGPYMLGPKLTWHLSQLVIGSSLLIAVLSQPHSLLCLSQVPIQ